MSPRITTAVLDEGTLRKTLAEYKNDLVTIYLESETRVVLAPLADFLGPRITLPPVRWTIGRAFGTKLEIRWQSDGIQFETAALTESSLGPSDWQPGILKLDAETRSRDVLMAGVNNINLPPHHPLYNVQSDGKLWIAEHLPYPLRYPVSDPKAERVVLCCVDYLYRGLVVLTRMREFVPYKPS
jgi:hypothetical protein